jgi:membrane associated rhomboid family serine protease
MTNPSPEPLEALLKQIAQAETQPWYPKAFAESFGIPRESLDAPLERLRLRGLVRLTEWQAGTGQGYVLTEEGRRIADDPRLLAQLRNGTLPPPADAEPEPDRSAAARREAVRDALRNPARPVVTFTLIAINLVVFVTEYFWLRGPDVIYDRGVLSGELLARGEWWRLLTCCFLHAGLLHVGINMLSLYNLGREVEPLWGRWRYLVLYLVAGLGGSVTAMVVTPNSSLVGASGAVCGLLGALAAFVLANRAYLPRELVSTCLRDLGINCILILVISFGIRNVSAAGHIGGGLVGLATGLLMNYDRFGFGAVRWLARAGVVALVAACLLAVVAAQRLDPRWGVVAARADRDGDDKGKEPDKDREARDRRRKEEIKSFNEEVLRPTLPLEQDAWNAYEKQVKGLLDQGWQDRDPKDAKLALEVLPKAQDKLKKAAAQVPEQGHYSSPFVETARTDFQEDLAAKRRLLELAERCLKLGKDWTEKEDADLRQQQKRVEEAAERWEAHLGDK